MANRFELALEQKLEELAREFDETVESIRFGIWFDVQNVYDHKDVKDWLDGEGISYDDELVDKIVKVYQQDECQNRTLCENIESAYRIVKAKENMPISVKVFDINYDIDYDDCEVLDREDYSTEEGYEEAFEKASQEILAELPEELYFSVPSEYADDSKITDYLADKITGETGFLINGFQYVKIEQCEDLKGDKNNG